MNIPGYTKIILLIIFLLFADHFYSQTFRIKNYTYSDGIPEQMIYDVAQDSSGLMWFATEKGIYTYDGNTWIQIKEPSIPIVRYIRIKIDEAGGLWFLPYAIGYPIVRYHAGNWMFLPVIAKNNMLNTTSLDILFRTDGSFSICVSTMPGGVYYYHQNEWHSFTVQEGLLSKMIFDVKFHCERILVSTDKGISIIDDFKVSNEVNSLIKINDPGIFSTIVLNQKNEDSEIWLLAKSWVGVLSGNNFKIKFNDFEIPFPFEVEFFFFEYINEKELYFGNRTKIFIRNFDSNSTSVLGKKEGLITDGATSVFRDYEHNVWVSSLRGISKLINSKFNNFSEADGLLENEVSAVSQFDNGLYFFGHNYGLTLTDLNKSTRINFIEKNGKTNLVLRVLDVFKDTLKNEIWIASNNRGLGVVKQNRTIKWYTTRDYISYYSVYLTSEKELLLGSTSGLYVLQNERLVKHKYFTEKVLIRKILEMPDGTLLFGTPDGLFTYKNKNTEQYLSENLSANNIFALFNDSPNESLIGTLDGLYSFDGSEIKKYSKNNLSIDNPVYFIIRDNDNNLWFGLDIGVAKWNGDSLTYYGINEGLSGNETNRAAGFVDSEGRVWIGTNNGVSVYDKYYDDRTIEKPKVEILSIQDNFNLEYNPKDNLTLPSSRNNLTIFFRALTFIDEEKTRYFIKIENQESDWKYEYSTTERFARFNNLPSGKYKFTLYARNVRGINSETIQSSLITINRPYYNQLWFYISVVVLLGIIFYSFTDYYNQKKYAQSLEFEVKKRTEQLETSEKHYRTLVETSTDGILVISRDNIIKFSNRHAPKILGFNQNTDLRGENVFRFIPAHMQSEAQSVREQLQKSSESLRFEFELVNLNGKVFPAEINMSTIRDYDTGEKLFITIFRDISYIKQVQWRLENLNINLEKRVKDKTRELTALIEQSPLGIVIFNIDGNISEFNENFTSVYLDFAHGGPVSEYNLFKDKMIYSENIKSQIDKLLETGGNLMLPSIRCTKPENEMKKPTDERIFEVRFYTINNSSGQIERIAVLIDDVTERSHLEEMNRKLSEQMMRSSIILDTLEKERKRISRDLHDDLGQLFTTAKLKIEIFQHKTKIQNEHLSDALKLLLDAGRTISDIVHNLHPVEIERYGLMPALELLCEKIRKHYKINISMVKSGDIPQFDKTRELYIYRIIQEALINSVKHSGCSAIVLRVEAHNGLFKLIVEDNGRGIILDENGMPDTNGGHGIIGMIERVSLFNDNLKFENLKSGGTRITININYLNHA